MTFALVATVCVASTYRQVLDQPSIVVDSLVSYRYLKKRDSGYANGGDKPDGNGTYKLSFFHINDVHAYVSFKYPLWIVATMF